MRFRSPFRRFETPASDDAARRLVSPAWYDLFDPREDGDAYTRYRQEGWRQGATPNPWFSPDWYLAAYPDVAAAAKEPLEHYTSYGWRERRDPGPAFSASWYLDANPDVAAADIDPLTHFLLHGRMEGRRPHPLLQPLDLTAPQVGIVVVSFNAPEVLGLTLESLARNAGPIPVQVFVVENGSGDRVKHAVQGHVRAAQRRGLDVELIDEVENLGFSGGNNVGVSRALAAGSTHVCLLNSDVLVTPGWLESLIATTEPVVGPVSNMVGNEQTVPVDYHASRDASAFGPAEDFARRWRRAFIRNVAYTDFLGFFCVLLRRDVIEAVGLLDERFYPGSYEDDDYCLRLVEHGYRLAIARHVFVHHWGSASFERLPLERRLGIGDENRQRFEEKHGRVWCDRSHLPLRSWVQDQARDLGSAGGEALRTATLEAHRVLNEHAVQRMAQGLVYRERELVDRRTAMAALEEQIAASAAPAEGAAEPEALVWTFGDTALDLRGLTREERARYERMLDAYWRALEARDCVSLVDLAGAQPILVRLGLAAPMPLILLLCAGDPVNGLRGDGYLQRVAAIDKVLHRACRVYVRFCEDRRGRPGLTELAPGVVRLDVADGDRVGDALLDALLAEDARLYVHSVLRLEPASARRLLKTRRSAAVLDIHGALPEEFRMCDDPFSAQIFAGYERIAFAAFDAFVCVSRAMAEHYRAKYQLQDRQLIHCPVFAEPPQRLHPRRRSHERIRVVYAGGATKWQRVPQMLDLVAETCLEIDYVLLSTQPNVFSEGLARRGLHPGSHGVFVASVEPQEVWDFYQDADFGLILREDSIVNRVACPTKLVEYIAADVIPVLESTAVGDFVADGLQYVTVDVLRSGQAPGPVERRRMAAQNRSMFQKMMKTAGTGQAQIEERLHLTPTVLRPKARTDA